MSGDLEPETCRYPLASCRRDVVLSRPSVRVGIEQKAESGATER
jgi:hypothetical protein